MPPKENEKTMITPFMKWISGIISTLILMSIIYVASSIQSMAIEIVGMKRDITYLTETIKTSNSQSYPKTEIVAEFRATNLQVSDLSRRIDILEAKCWAKNNPQP